MEGQAAASCLSWRRRRLSNAAWTSSCYVLSSCALAYANMRRKLLVGEGVWSGRCEEREADLDGLAPMPARRVDMASPCFPTLGHEPVIKVIRKRKGEE